MLRGKLYLRLQMDQPWFENLESLTESCERNLSVSCRSDHWCYSEYRRSEILHCTPENRLIYSLFDLRRKRACNRHTSGRLYNPYFPMDSFEMMLVSSLLEDGSSVRNARLRRAEGPKAYPTNTHRAERKLIAA